jgi:hypothetical protein
MNHPPLRRDRLIQGMQGYSISVLQRCEPPPGPACNVRVAAHTITSHIRSPAPPPTCLRTLAARALNAAAQPRLHIPATVRSRLSTGIRTNGCLKPTPEPPNPFRGGMGAA